MQYTIQIPPGGAAQETAPNDFLTVIGTSAPFKIIFDGRASEAAQSGQIFDRRQYGGFRYAQFVNPNQVPITVTYDVGDKPATVQQSVRSTGTYFRGNLGYNVTADLPNPTNISLTSLSLVNSGFGYSVGDILTITGGTGTAARIKVLQVWGILNRISQFTFIDANGNPVGIGGSYTVAPSSPNSPTGGTGTSAQFSFQTSGGQTATIANGLITLTSGNQMFVDSIDGLNSRKQIVFHVTNGTLAILDLGGRTLFRVGTSSPLTLESNAQMIIQAVGGNCTFSIGETYFSQP